MAEARYYRGGDSLLPRPMDLRFDRATGLVKAERGVSVSTRPNGLDRFGGAYLLGPLPDELQYVQIGKDPHHFEVIPIVPISLERFEELLERISLTRV